MTKTDLITAINTQLTAIITQAKVRLASLQLVKELFPTEVLQNIPTGSVTCYLRWKKIGNEARVCGFIKNNSNSVVGSSFLVPLINSTFTPKIFGEIFQVNNNIKITINNDGISFIGVLSVGQELYINESYQIND